MNLFTRKMKMLLAIVLEEDKDKVVKSLLKTGAMDFVRLSDFDKDTVGRLSQNSDLSDRAEIVDLRMRTEALMREAEIKKPDMNESELDSSADIDMAKIRRFLDQMSIALQKTRDRQKTLNQNILTFLEMEKYLEDEKSDYVSVRFGKVGSSFSSDFAKRIRSYSSAAFQDGDSFILVSFKRDQARVDEMLGKFGWIESEDGSRQAGARKKAADLVKEENERLKEDMLALQKEAKDKICEKKDTLEKIWKRLRLAELSLSVQSFFSHTRNTTLFSGWVPSDEYEKTVEAIMLATGGKCIIEEKSDEEIDRTEIPVSISSPKFLRPFERMVNNYGTPEYGSINPTPFTAVSYFLMFTLMFADLGQGFVLLLAALAGLYIYKKNPDKKDGLISRNLCQLLLYLAPASMIGGLLFGSCFGYSLLPPIWFNYHAVVNGHAEGGLVTSVYDILGITIKFGICIIFTGLVLNWINLFKKKRYFELVFDKYGLVGGALYALGIYYAFGFVANGYRMYETPSFFMPLLVFLLLVVVIKEPVHYVIKRRAGVKESISSLIMNTVMESLIQCLEIFSGFLANTLSFMRVAGLGIAHVSLMTAFEDIASMTGNTFFYILIMILGNALVIVLEGLSAGINSLRLNYYEFFTKYFTGRGFAYSPIGLDGRKEVN